MKTPKKAQDFGRRLRGAIDSAGFKYTEFAEKAGIKPNTLSNYLNEVSRPAFETLGTFVEILGVTTDYLLGVTDQPKQPSRDAQPNAQVTAQPSPENQNEKDKKTETPTAVSVVAAYVTGASIQVRPVVVAVDARNDERITLVEEAVHAGYQRGYADESFVSTLPTFTLPGFTGRTYRAFEVRGDSMAQTIQPRDIIICSYVEDWRFLRNNYVYVVVSPDAGLVVKRLSNRIDQRGRGHIICTSDNAAEHPPFQLPATPEHISELWQVELRLTKHLSPPPPAPELATRVGILEMQYQDLMERLQPAQAAIGAPFFDD